MKVLVACECSQKVAAAFREKGHDAFSCDIEPSYGGFPEFHICDDVLPLLAGDCGFFTEDGSWHFIEGRWDMIIAFPPCTYLTNACNRHFSLKRNTPEQIAERVAKRDDAVSFFMAFIDAPCDLIVVENPVGYMNSHFRKPDQIIQPYYFGDDYEKATCLWLKGVPCLAYTNVLPRPAAYYYRRDGKAIRFVEAISATGGQKNRAKIRSETFSGVAAAMAAQWG